MADKIPELPEAGVTPVANANPASAAPVMPATAAAADSPADPAATAAAPSAAAPKPPVDLTKLVVEKSCSRGLAEWLR